MSQQVNLFESGLVKSKDWFTLTLVAAVYALAALAMVYFYTGIESENAQLVVQRDQAVAQYESMQKKVDEFAQKATPVDNSKLEAELKKLNSRFEMQSQILAIFQQSISENAYHLIDYMRALTGQQQPGLWLTGFRIEPSAQHVSLSGQALQTEDIPLYLDLLSAQRVFEGTQFSGLQFKQVELQKNVPAPAAVAATAPPVAAPTPQASGKGASAAAPVATPATPAATSAPVVEVPVKLQVYAFDVKGQDLRDKTKAVSAMSWDEFVGQTGRSPQSKPQAQQP
ncbi:MAG: PilN domain-containing protein [Methylophilus sp.]|uniref:PilN domain-containing protein n=1 Tax=Methylophilus sp. TaxID=29541 RepID=UPI003F9EC181